MDTAPVTKPRTNQNGFTLVELVITMVLMGIVAAMLTTALAGPIRGFIDQLRRIDLTSRADIALRQMSRDVRQAVPNTLRACDLNGDGIADAAAGASTTCIEFLHALHAARYLPNRSSAVTLQIAPGNDANCLPQNAGNDCDRIEFAATGLNLGSTRWLVAHNYGALAADNATPVAGRNVYAAATSADGDHVITPTGSTFIFSAVAADATLPARSAVDVAPPGGSFLFARGSSARRLYFADNLVRYTCSGGQLLRQTSHLILPGAIAGGEVLAAGVTQCSFNLNPLAVAASANLLTMSIEIMRGSESINLLHEVFIENQP